MESTQNARFGRIAQTLQGIVGRVLRIEPRDIDIEAPFLELGADSLALVEALRGLQDAFGVKLTIRQLFEQLPSIAALATFLDQTLPAEVAAAPVPAPAPAAQAAPVVQAAPAAPAMVAPAPPPVPHPPAPSPATPAPLPGRGGEQPLERVFGMQIQAFNQLVAQQLQMLGGRPAAQPQPVALPASPPLSPGGGEEGRERGPGGEGQAAPAAPLKPVLPTYLGKAARPATALSERQQKHLDALVERYTRKTAKSKELTQRYRSFLADSRATVGFRPQVKEMLYPLARARSAGSRVWDVDGNEYVDVTMGMGVHLFGHDPEFLRDTLDRQVREGFELGPRSAHSGEVAALFCELTGMERATFTNSGTEACMTAIRLARAKTGRSRIVMFAGSYHGHSDGTLAQTQEVDGELRSFPVAPGIPAKVAEEVLVLDYGSPQALEQIRERRHEIAAVIVEPIQSRRPDLQPREFLHELRKLTAESGIALIFDEMICGFRLHLGGAQAHFGVRADLATYGKIVGGGLPIGVVAGSAEYMDGIDGGMWRYGDDSRPERETTFFGGTFCQHPLAMAAALRTLQYLKDQGPGLQETLNARTAAFTARLNRFFEGDKVPIRAVSAHSLFRFNFSANADLLFYHLVDKGVYVWEWRNCFLSTAHTDADLDFVVNAIEESVAELRRGGFLPEPPSPSGPGDGKLAFWDRQGKPSIAPVREPAEAPAVSASVAADREIRFGLYFFGNYQAEFGAGKYDLLFDCARFGDRHRFAALWFPERHFHPFGGLSPNPSVLAAALARETERIALRAGSVVLPLHHPVRVAEEWALVDNLSGGRVGLSYASGWHPNDFALAPESYGNHRELMFERIDTVRRLWQGESVRVKDGAGSDVDLHIYPLPARRDLPIWITIVNNPDTYRRAGEIGAGVLTNLMGQTLDDLARNVAVYREALKKAGHPPEAGHVAVLLHTFVGSDAGEAIETARRPFYRYLESSVGLLKSMIASEGHKVDLDRLSPEDLEYMLGLAYQRYVTTSALIGSPETCAPIVERMRAIGVDEIACLVDFGVEASKVRESFPWLAALKDRFRDAGRSGPGPAETIEIPLTELQEDLYTVVRMGETASVAYNEPGTLGLAGPLDVGLLRQALRDVVARHEALRTVIPLSETSAAPVQRVLPEVRLDVPLVDVSALPEGLRDPAAQEAAAAVGREPFDLARGPLVRAAVIRLSSRSHLFFLSVHHVTADGLSVVILLQEVFALYEAGRAGRRGVLPPPFQFREYVEWLRAEQADLSREEAYWRGVFDTLPPAFDPPTDRPRPPVRTFRGARESAALDAELRRAVQQLGRRRGATFFITLLAGWTALLHRWTGQDDLVVGVPLARRPLEGGDRLIGHCVDISPIRSRVEAGTTFADHLGFVRGRLFGAHDHGAYSFSRLVRAVKPPRDLSRAPLSNATFNLDQDLGIARAGGLEILGRSSGVHGVKNDIAVHCLEREEELLLDAEYSTDLFDPATVRRLFGAFRTLLLGAAADPGAPLSALPSLDIAERSQVLSPEAAPGERPASGPRTVIEDLLAAIWAEMLGVETVSGEDSFFDLGGHSLLATRLLGRLRGSFGVDLPLQELFERPTLSALAGRIARELRDRVRRGPRAAPPPISAAPADPGRERRAPLSFAQERLWFLDRLNPGSILYNLPVALRIAGGEESAPVPPLLEAALSEVVRRHEALRTVFAESGEEPEQVVRPFAPVPLPEVDLAGLPEAARAGEAARIEREEGRRPFDLAAGPLLRPLLLTFGGGESALVLATHHIVADGWSFGVLASELAVLCRAGAEGEPSPLPPLPVQYADFALWQRRWLAGPALEAQLAWWRERLAEVPPPLELPADRPWPADPSWEGAIEPLALPRRLADDLRRLSRERRATPFMVVLAAFETVLSRLTGRDDFLVGTPIANRTRVETEGLAGFFVNTLVLRADLTGEPSFGVLLGRVRETTLGAYAHQDLPFEKLVEALSPGRDLSRNPFVQITFAMQNTPRPDGDLGGGRTATLEELDPGISKFDLTLFFHEAPDGGLGGGIEYATDLFDAATVRRHGAHLLTFLAAAVAAPETAVSELPLLTPEERDHVLRAWNRTETAYPRETPVHHLFAEAVARAPEAPAVIEGEEILSYGELARRAGLLARRLRELGVGPEAPVALDLERSSGLIVAMLAVLQAGGAYVPLDPGDPEERRAFLLADTGAKVRIDREAMAGLPEAGGEPGPGAPGSGDSLAYVLYTSGSTGRPKGVAVSHRAINRLVLDTDYVRLGPGDRVAHLSNTAFDASTFEVWGALLTGAALVVIPKDVAVSPSALAAEVRRRGITVMFLTTALFNEMAREAPEALGEVRHLLFGGEAVSPRRVREARAAARPGARLLHVYGPTESTTFTTWHEVGEVPPGDTVPIGLPLANTRVHLVDRHLEPVPVGAPGELVIGGDGLARGYLGRPDLTAERFTPDPWGGDGGRLYRTGDLARRRPDGAIEFLGRTDAQVKVRGFRIEPGEVEAVLAGCPGVRECAVVPREEAEGRRLVAFAVLDEGAAPDLRGYLRERLPEWMVPAGFAVLDALPMTPSGKVDRRALARLETPDGAGPERPFEAPRTPVEQIVAGLWAEVLERERIGLGDDFFDLGGHSLLAGRVLSRLRGVLGVDLPLRAFFEDSTLSGLARRLERARQEAGGVAPPPLVRVPRDGSLRLSFGQERLWLAEQLQRGSGAYNSFLPGAMRGRLDFPVLARVLLEIQRRHEVLRTVYAAGADGPVQAIAPASSLASWFLPVADLSALPAEEGKAELRRLSAEEALRPFDLARGPLFRPTLLRLAPEEHVLFLDLHHSICDGWSFDVLIRELAALYRAFSSGRPSPLPDLPVQYADFAQWQRRWLAGEVFETQLDWWRCQLGEKPPVLDLPTDRPRPPVQSARGANLPFALPPELAAGLRELARRGGSTLFTVLLAAFQVVLHRWSGQERVSVGTPVAGRTRVEVEGLIGFFVNTLVLSSDLSGDPTIPELLDRARAVTLGAFDHQDLPFEKLVAALETERDPSRQPLFQAMLVLQNNRTPDIELPGMTLGIVPASGGATPFDLVLSLNESGETLEGVLTYGTDLFEAATAALLVEDFRRVLAALVEGSGRLSEIPRLAGEDRREARASAPAPAASGKAAPEEDAAERRRAEIEERRRQLSSRRGQLSPERRALLQKWVGGKAPASEAAPAAADPLVALRPEGSRPPLFVVHAGAGVTHEYLALAGHLGPDQPFYGLQSPGLAGGELFDSLGAMASRYLEAVRSVQPRGPYRVGGWCTGGVVAFEMTRQLLERGEEVDLLALLDSPAPDPGAPRTDDLEMLAGMIRQLGEAAGLGLEVPFEELQGIPADAWLDRVVELGRERGALPPSFDAEQARRHWQVVRANVRAVESYVPPGRCAVRSVVFRATRQSPGVGDRTSRDWERWLAGPLEILEVEGDHAALVHDPGAGIVARHLRVRLEAEEAAAVRSGV